MFNHPFYKFDQFITSDIKGGSHSFRARDIVISSYQVLKRKV